MELRRAYLGSALILAVGIAAGSMLRQDVTAVLQTAGRLHEVVHVLVFACLTGLLIKSTRVAWLRLLFCAGTVLLGFGTEWYEHLKDGYPIESMDVIADAVGAGLATLAVFVGDLLAYMRQQRRIG